MGGNDTKLAAFGDGIGQVTLTRRSVLTAMGAGGAATLLSTSSRSGSQAGAQTGATGGAVFPDGMISGDPQPDGAVLWTRIDPNEVGGATEVTCTVLDDSATTVLATLTSSLDAADGYTVHIEVAGLAADSWYRYRFTVGSATSPTGRFRTAPAVGSSPERLRFAFVSCQQRSSPYVAHTAMLDEDLDFLVHLGDYIYVNDFGTYTLDDYRGVWRTFRSDPALQELHRSVPLVAMWDDGEIYNGYDNTGDPDRLAAAKTAFIENMPLLRPSDDPDRLYRTVGWGSLATMPVVDVRTYRDPAVDATDNETPEGSVVMEPDRTTLGVPQRDWLMEGLASAEATWKLVAAGYNVLPVRLADRDTPERRAAEPNLVKNAGDYFPNEAFDDYQVERRQILQRIYDDCIENVVFVAGHTHVFLGGRLYPDYDDAASPLVAHEFVTGSLTADPPPEGTVRNLTGNEVSRAEAIEFLRGLEAAGLAVNEHLDHINLVDQGYAVVEVTPDLLRVEFKVLDTFAADPAVTVAWSYEVPRGATPSSCPTPPQPPPEAPPAVPAPVPPRFVG